MSVLSKIDDIKKQRKIAHSRLLALKSKVYKKFLEMEQATYVNGALKKKEKELIAIGISTVINCESCIQWHITEAAKSGATHQEILEAIEVAIEFGGGPATVSARFALEVLETLFNDSQHIKKS
jgi:AhpD family alkylhydroperoxidase